MKTKNVSFVDKYIEKLVVAVAALFFLAVVYLYGVGDPYKAKVGAVEKTPVEVEEQLRRDAEALKQKVKSTESPLPDMTLPPYAARFKERVQRPLVGGQPLLALSLSGIDADIADIDKVGDPRDRRIIIPNPPKPTNTVARGANNVLVDAENIRDYYAEIARIEVAESLPLIDPNDPNAPQPPTQDEVDEMVEKRLDEIVAQVTQLVGDRQPGDFAYTSIRSDFDLNAWLESVRDVDEANRAPEGWLVDKVLITGVFLERQTLDPATGQWGEVETIKPLPGTPMFDQNSDVTGNDAVRLLTRIRTSEPLVTSPNFVPTTMEPVAADAPMDDINLEDARRAIVLEKEIEECKKKIRLYERQLGIKSGETPNNTRPTPTTPEVPNDGVGLFDSPPSNTNNRKPPRTTQRPPRENKPNPAAERRKELIRQRLAAAQEECAMKEAELAAIINPALRPAEPLDETELEAQPRPGRTPTTAPRTPTTSPRTRTPTTRPRSSTRSGYSEEDYARGLIDESQLDPSIPRRGAGARTNVRPRTVPSRTNRNAPRRGAKQDEVETPILQLHGYDLTVERGKTYRYRMRVNMFNPLYKRGDLSEEQKAENDKKFVLASEASEWTQPVAFESGQHIYVVDAKPKTKQATFEVWHIFDGVWTRSTFTASPGDMIGGKASVPFLDGEVEIDLSLDAVLVDVKEELDAAAQNKSQTKVLITDPSGTTASALRQRDPQQDLENPARKRLELKRMRVIPPADLGGDPRRDGRLFGRAPSTR